MALALTLVALLLALDLLLLALDLPLLALHLLLLALHLRLAAADIIGSARRHAVDGTPRHTRYTSADAVADNRPVLAGIARAHPLLPITPLGIRPGAAIAAAIVNIGAVAGIIITARPAETRAGIAIGHRTVAIGIAVITVVLAAILRAAIGIAVTPAVTPAVTITIAGGAGGKSERADADERGAKGRFADHCCQAFIAGPAARLPAAGQVPWKA